MFIFLGGRRHSPLVDDLHFALRAFSDAVCGRHFQGTSDDLHSISAQNDEVLTEGADGER